MRATAERLREAVARTVLGTTTLGLSVGLATSVGAPSSLTAELLLATADESLYRDKRSRHPLRAA